ncbi:MAG: cytochrome b5 domain-containing protein [Chloroflexota bacterium]
MRIVTREELAICNGRDGASAWVAVDGLVYDVSKSWHWKGGKHQARHFAGREYTAALEGAPHGPDLLRRCPLVGVMTGCSCPLDSAPRTI